MSRRLSQWLLTVLLFTVLPSAALAQAGDRFFFRDGDRVVFLGDSITEQDLYTWYIETYLLTRFPRWQLRFRNAGWGGDTAWLRQRNPENERELFGDADPSAVRRRVGERVHVGLERDVLPFRPTAVTIDFGMNDARLGERALDVYQDSVTELVRQLEAADARVALLTPSPEQRHVTGEPGGSVYNRRLMWFSDRVWRVALREGARYVDQLYPFLDVLADGTRADPQYNLVPDGVHPNAAGHLVMAWAILKELDAPALVSEAALDASGHVVAERGCRIDQVRTTADGLSFRRRDDALPWYISPDTRASWAYTPVFEDLDRYVLRVTGLPAPRYRLSIEDVSVGVLTREQLAEGWNIAAAGDSPATERSRRLHDLVKQKNRAYYSRWRDPLRGRTVNTRQLDHQIRDLEQEIDAVRRPRRLRFELVAVGE